MPILEFYPHLLLRTPAGALHSFLDRSAMENYLRDHPAFRESLYLASPTLLEALETSKSLNNKSLFPLSRYILRNHYRCTPFGLFSGVARISWGNTTSLVVSNVYRKRTHLSIEVLTSMTEALERDPLVKKELRFYPNNSLYLMGNHYRYIERKDVFLLSSVDKNLFLSQCLNKAQKGITIQQLENHLQALGAEKMEAKSFVRSLIDGQILISELQPTLTGKDFLSKMVSILKRIQHPLAQPLTLVAQKLRMLDASRNDNLPRYKEITHLLKDFNAPSRAAHHFSVTRINQCLPSAQFLNKNLQEEIRFALCQLLRWSKPNTMQEFINRFYDRYEDEEVPLLMALDSESGIGYPTAATFDYTPFIEGIHTQTSHKLPQSPSETDLILFQKLQKALIEQAYEITLPDLPNSCTTSALPPSVAVLFRLMDHENIFLEFAGGCSATVLAARFGCASTEVKKILEDLSKEESLHNPEVTFAEIVHLPTPSTANVLRRPAFRAYEIPYLSPSSLPVSRQILLKNLYVSVRNNEVILRDKKRNKRIIPRLSCAHNYRNPSLPLYRFLCDLQDQGVVTNLSFSWRGVAHTSSFLPRVRIGKVVISPATWRFTAPNAIPTDTSTFEHWREHHRIPKQFVLAEGDNELFFDSTLPFHQQLFTHTVQLKQNIVIKEFIGGSNSPVKNYCGKPMAHQLLAFITQKKPVYFYKAEKSCIDQTPRVYGPGSEWLYLKYYCGVKFADYLLVHGIAPMLHQAERKGWIRKWFFVRHQDPDHHLRVRFHLTNVQFLQQLLRCSDRYMRNFLKAGMVWKVQTDTYRRELERYGFSAIQYVEEMFHTDSRMYMDFLYQTEGDEREKEKWLWGLRCIHRMLSVTHQNLVDRRSFVLQLRNAFAAEFKMESTLQRQLARRFRRVRPMLEKYLDNDFLPPILPSFYHMQFQKQWTKIMELELGFSCQERILSSLIHMAVNRLISSQQRLHELMLYDFLYRYYSSLVAQEVKAT